MDILIICIFLLIGVCFGSFSTVLIERWHSKKGGILLGRSECPYCHHRLGILELFPIISYIFLRGKCRHCKKSIPLFYPIAEVSMGIIFGIMAWVGINFGYLPTDMMWWVFIFWGFVTGVYILYDLRFMEIPDQIMVPGIYGTLLLIGVSLYTGNLEIFFDISTYDTFHTFLTDHLSGAIILYSFLYLQILIPGGIFLLKKGDIKKFLSICYSYFLLPFVLIIPKKEDQQEEEMDIPSWVGGGDLRIALFIGITLGSTHGIASFFFAYIIGSFFGVGLLIYKNLKKEGEIKHEIPFGPFLGIGWILSLVFYNVILSYIII